MLVGGDRDRARDRPEGGKFALNSGVAILTFSAVFTDWQHPQLYCLWVARQ